VPFRPLSLTTVSARLKISRRTALIVGAVLVLLAGTVTAIALNAPADKPAKSLVYSDLLKAMDDRQVASAELSPNRSSLHVELRDGRAADLAFPPAADDLADRLADAGARVSVRAPRPGIPTPLAILLVAIVVLASVALVRHASRKRRAIAAGADMDLRKTAEVSDDTRPALGFRDVAGCEEAVEEVSEFVEFLRDPARFASVGAKMPSGVILHGPPGTGKTLLAKALAGEAGCSFFAVSGSDFVEQFVGVGAKRVRDLFSRARESEDGAVIFIDEIDAIGKKRSGNAAGGAEEREGTLNELLVQMDGFPTDRRVVVVAATNRLDTLDDALLRPGRFARQVRVDLPTEDGRREILGLHAQGKPLAEDVDLDRLARVTSGCSGADLEDMLNEAAIMAARSNRGLIAQEDLEEGFLRAIAGPEKRSGGLSADEKETVAAHEAGHVLCAELCASADKAQRATIRPRGRAAGLAVYGRTDRSLHDAESIHVRLVCLLGGRAAEWVRFGKVSSGAANDLQQANSIARSAVQELGLSDATGKLVDSGGPMSDATRAIMDSETERLVAEAYRDAIALLEEHRDELDRLTEALLTAEDVDRAEILVALGPDLPQRTLRPNFGSGRPAVAAATRVDASRAG
jgi:cell division protease FtsH